MIKTFKKYTAILILTVFANASAAQIVDHWETIVQNGDDCKYYIPSSDIGTDWIANNFDDSGWITAPSGIGYGDDDDNTIIADGTNSVYIRYAFTIESVSQIASLLLDVDYDDGFIAYLNGAEVARANIMDPVTWNMQLNGIHEAAMYSGGNPERFFISTYLINELLLDGENILALEVHNESANSSDLSSNLFLHAGINDSEMVYGDTPAWFWEPITVTNSDLPLMIINSNGQKIVDDPRIVADMGLIYNGVGETNSVFDAWNEYSGKISIEIRGESSMYFDKKSFSIELQNDDGSNNNVSLLGMPEENDFVLYGPYSDKTMIKNVLTYELFRLTGRWAPRTSYIEIILDDEYRGIYVLTEKLKRDENRVDIDKLTSDDTTPEEISGGYILRRDKTNGMAEEEYWESPVNQPYHQQITYQYFDPKFYDLTPDQANYIKDWMQGFDETLSGNDFKDPENGYSKYIKVRSFIDMLFINEISKGIDNYLFSTYFYKENDADGGQLVAGAPWDYNLGYGNLDYGLGWNAPDPFGWVYTQGGRIYWYKRLLEDENFQDKVSCRWTAFRETIYSDENVENIIDSCINVMGNAIDRNFIKYPILGEYIWPAKEPIPDTYEGEIENLKSWLFERLEWLDSQWLATSECAIDIKIDNNSIYENLPTGKLIGTFSAFDENQSDINGYELVDGIGSDDNQSFTISDNQLLNAQTFDFETKNLYTIRVQAEDSQLESTERIFEINILDDPFEVTSTMEIENIPFSLFPNPTSGIIQIVDNEDISNRVDVQLFDLTGRLLFEYTGDLNGINSGLKNDSRSLKSGVYFIRINSGEHSTTLKFIKS